MSFSDPRGLDWYQTADGSLVWLNDSRPFVGPVGDRYVAELRDEFTDEIIDPNAIGGFISNGRDEWRALVIQSCRYFSQGHTFGNPAELKRRALSSEPSDCEDPGGFDIKNRSDLVFGAGVNNYTIVNGRVLQNQDWGNALFGAYSRAAGFPALMLHLGAGYAQLSQGTWRWKDWESFFDDPRDQYFIRVGFNGGIYSE